MPLGRKWPSDAIAEPKSPSLSFMDVVVIIGKADAVQKSRKNLHRILLQDYKRVLWKQPRRGLDSILSPFLPKWKSLEARIQLMFHYETMLASIDDNKQVVVLEHCLLGESLKCTAKEWSYLCHKFEINPFSHAENCYHQVLVSSGAGPKERRLMLGHHRVHNLPTGGIASPLRPQTKRYLVPPSATHRLAQDATTVMQEEIYHQGLKATLVKRNQQESCSYFIYQSPRHTRLTSEEYRNLSRETSAKPTLKKLSHFQIRGEFAKVETFVQPPLEMSILELPASVPLPDKFPVIGTV
jgi:hypothetical protein